MERDGDGGRMVMKRLIRLFGCYEWRSKRKSDSVFFTNQNKARRLSSYGKPGLDHQRVVSTML